MPYRYETHMHTAPVSRCAQAGVEETLELYRDNGFDGVFITNHFLDGNINCPRNLPYRERLEFYLTDYYEALQLGKRIGIKVFFGVELSHGGTDFLVYGLSPDWYRRHPEIMDMKKSDELAYLHEAGAMVVHAHPFREARYIDHLRLFPRHVQAVEILNANNCSDFENEQGRRYAEAYGLPGVAGTDNHWGKHVKKIAGVLSETPFETEQDYIRAVQAGTLTLFLEQNENED